MNGRFRCALVAGVLSCALLSCGAGDPKNGDDAGLADAAPRDTAGTADRVEEDAGPLDIRGPDDVAARRDETGGADADTAQPADPFKQAGNWAAFDANNIGDLKTVGYFGAIYDGRYVYHVPCRDNAGFHARALRHDTQGEFKDAGSWSAFDAAGTDGLGTVGYGGGAFDGRYVYYAPFTHDEARHAEVLRYDTEGEFDQATSWSAHDASNIGGTKAVGFVDAVFDGRYVYFSPFGYAPFAHGRVIRYDTQGDFKAAESWAVHDAGFTGGLITKGYYGLILEGKYIYFVPFNDGTEFHGRVLRYDTSADFKSESSWSSYDAGFTDEMDTRGYKMAASDGRFIYFVPFRTSTAGCHGRVLRYDTEGDFGDSGSWRAWDAGATDQLETTAYVGAVFDGTHIYFCPYSHGAVDFHAMALRHDTTADFLSPESWAAFEANPIDGLTTKGYKGIVFDGRYVHYTPYYDGTALRFDTAGQSGQ